MKRKTSYYDKLNILAHKPQYIDEYKELFPELSSSSPSLELIFSHEHNLKVERFKKRWDLEYVIDPNEIKLLLENDTKKDFEGGAFAEYHEIVKVLPHKKNEVIRKKKRGTYGDYLDLSCALRSKKYLTLQIDVTADETKIVENIKSYIELYREIINHKKKRVKSSIGLELDHWEIYRKKHCEGKSLPEIARERLGVSKDDLKDANEKEYNKFNAKLKQIERAYEKAKDMIDQYKPKNS